MITLRSVADRCAVRQVLLLPVLVLLVAGVACDRGGVPPPTNSTTPPSPQAAPTFGPQGERTPPTLQDYVQQADLAAVSRIEFVDPRTQETRVITHERTIRRIIDLFRTTVPPADTTPSGRQVERSFLLVLSAPDQGRVVSAEYHPRTQHLQLANVPNGMWPVKLTGQYNVPPNFGQALFTILEIR